MKRVDCKNTTPRKKKGSTYEKKSTAEHRKEGGGSREYGNE